MSQNLNSAVAVIGIDIGKNSFHIVGLDSRTLTQRHNARKYAWRRQWPKAP
jgi:hypothetical protein